MESPCDYLSSERPSKRQRKEQYNDTINSISNSDKKPMADLQRRMAQSNCVELVSMLFDVYGYTVIMPKLYKVYSGSVPIKDWYNDVSRYVRLNYKGEELNDEQVKLVQSVQKIATSKYGGLIDQQWRSLLSLNIRVDRRYDSTKINQIHMQEVNRVKKLAMSVLSDTQQKTVLALVDILEKYANKILKNLAVSCDLC